MEILRLLGILFILVGSIGLGLYYCALLTARFNNLIKLRNVLDLIACEVSYQRLPIHQILERISLRCGEPFDRFFASVACRLSDGSGMAVYDIWQEESSLLPADLIEKNAYAVFMEFPLHFGHYQADMQRQALNGLSERFRLIQDEMQIDISNKKKLYVTMGVFAGAMCAVWLW